MRDPAPDRARFVSLIGDLLQMQGTSQRIAAADLQSIQRISFEIDDVEFTAIHCPLPEPNLLIHCYFGRLASDRSRVLRNAMLINGAIANAASAMVAVDSSSDQLVYSIPENLLEVSPQALLDGLTEISAVAKTWRDQGLVSKAGRQP